MCLIMTGGESHAVPLYFYAFLINSVYVCIACFWSNSELCLSTVIFKSLYTLQAIPTLSTLLWTTSFPGVTMRNSIVGSLPDEKNGNISHRILSISRPSMLTLPGRRWHGAWETWVRFSYFNLARIYLLGMPGGTSEASLVSKWGGGYEGRQAS